MNRFLASVKKTPVPSGTAALWWLGQMGLLIRMGETVLCVDYFASEDPGRKVPAPVPTEEVEGIDLFLGTHNHLDHMDHTAWQVWAKTCPKAGFVFPALHTEQVLSDGVREENCHGLTEGRSFALGNVRIRCLAAAHEFPDQDPETGFYPHLQYIIEGNGVRIYHAGDTLRYEGMLPKLKQFGPVDAALLPINGRDGVRYRNNCIGNMTFQEAADLAGELRPGLVIPGHWDMFEGNTGNPEAFADYLDAKYAGKVACRIPEYLEEIRVRRATGVP